MIFRISKIGRFLSPVFAVGLFLCPLAVDAKKAPKLTPMELQSLQSREFETTKATLFASVMSVFQDLGYQIDNADIQTGFISATSASINKAGFLDALAGVSASGSTRATGFVEQMPNGMARVRLNFLNTKTSSSIYGQSSREDRPIFDPIVYRSAWDKIDEALFVRSAIEADPQKPSISNPPSSIPPVEDSVPQSAQNPK